MNHKRSAFGEYRLVGISWMPNAGLPNTVHFPVVVGKSTRVKGKSSPDDKLILSVHTMHAYSSYIISLFFVIVWSVTVCFNCYLIVKNWDFVQRGWRRIKYQLRIFCCKHLSNFFFLIFSIIENKKKKVIFLGKKNIAFEKFRLFKQNTTYNYYFWIFRTFCERFSIFRSEILILDICQSCSYSVKVHLWYRECLEK